MQAVHAKRHDLDAVVRLAQAGAALTLPQLAIVSGYPYTILLIQAKRPGFPIFDGRVVPSEYHEWRRTQMERRDQPVSAPQK